MEVKVHGWQSLSRILALDEEALSVGAPLVQLYRCERTSATIGVSQSPEVLRTLLEALPEVEVLRRPSGGSGLLHQRGDIFWSVVLPRKEGWVGRDFIHRYANFGAGWVTFLAGKGISATWEPAQEAYPPYCLLSGRGEVLVTKGRALGGANQHVTFKALLHHGTVAVTIDRSQIGRAFEVGEGLAQERLTSMVDEGGEFGEADLKTVAVCIASTWQGPRPG